MRIIFTLLLLVLSQKGMAVDCSEQNITLSTQSAVDSFQETYGTCDTIKGNLTINGSMSNLDGLLKLNRVEGSLIIEGNSILDSLNGLKNIRRVQGNLRINNNRSENKLIQRGKDIDGESEGDKSGVSVSLSSDGKVMAIGAEKNDGNGSDSGHARIYHWNGSSWQKLGSDIDGENSGDRSGANVSLNGNGTVVAIGAIYNDRTDLSAINTGNVRVFEWKNSSWIQRGAAIEGEEQNDYSGSSVSLSKDGNVLAIGSPFADAAAGLIDVGTVRIYGWNGSEWIQKGSDIDGEAGGDLSGYYYGVALNADGNSVAIGAPYNNGKALEDSGHVRVYRWNGTTWIQLGNDIDGESSGDWNGWSVSLSRDGSLVAIAGVYNDGNGIDSGHVRVYRWNGLAWVQRGKDIYGVAGDLAGYNISLAGDGSIVAVGAIFSDVSGSDAGRVDIYRWSGDNWESFGDPILGESVGDQSGTLSLSAGGAVVGIGAYYNDGAGINSGHVRVFDLGRLNCSGLSLLLGWPDGVADGVAGGTTIIGNGIGCNSSSEILEATTYFLDKYTFPATSCKAADPANSIKLQSRELGLINIEADTNISVACPLNREVFNSSISMTNVAFNITLNAQKNTDDTTTMSCTLSEYVGGKLFDSEVASINLLGMDTNFISWNNWKPIDKSTNYTITCDLPPQTSITSIETGVIY